jgi:hypothetical protein
MGRQRAERLYPSELTDEKHVRWEVAVAGARRSSGRCQPLAR